ncbi:MAG: hypothetical protein R3345_11300 [Fulvivirga sp.]|nr:hypothetical protein [Fulvivirga sp.]
MLSFFRLNDPYRLIFIFLILLVIRLPYMFADGHLTLPELDYMLVGEKLSTSNTLYKGLWENIAPLSAAVYMIIDYLFGRSQHAYYWLSLFVLFYQCALFNRMLLINKAYNENTYVPGAVYGILMSFFFDFITLTPVLMGLTFVLLALNNIFSHIEFRAKRDEKILNIGIYLGLASLFYLPFIIYGLGAVVIFMFFTGTVLRRYMLMFFGFLLPLMLAATYFLIDGRIYEFLYSFINPLISFESKSYISGLVVVIIFSLPLLLLLGFLVRVSQRARFTNYQSRLNQVMFVWMIFSGLFVVLSNKHAPNIYIVFIPALAFYISHYLLLIKRRIFAEGLFLLLVVSMVLLNHGTRFDFFITGDQIKLDRYLVGEGIPELEGKKVLILDDNLKNYINCKPATPFLDWNMVKGLFENIAYYDNQVTLYEGFRKDMPQVVVDPNGVMPKVFENIPILAERYEQRNGMYFLVN